MTTVEGFFDCGIWYMSRRDDPNDWGVTVPGSDRQALRMAQYEHDLRCESAGNFEMFAGEGI